MNWGICEICQGTTWTIKNEWGIPEGYPCCADKYAKAETSVILPESEVCGLGTE